jgi:hypothetical protein
VILADDDYRRLALFLADQAVDSAVGPRAYFDDLLRQAPLPRPFKLQKIGTFTGQADVDARALVSYAQTKGGNPQDPSWTTLGSLLRTLLESGTLGLEGVALLAGVIEVYGLCVDGGERTRFRARYGVPQRSAEAEGAGVPEKVGPEIDWQGPTDAVELQSWLGPEPVDFSLEFLQGAVRSARSVCRIELTRSGRTGSGVLIAPGLVLTNHHVIFGENGPEDAAEALAAECTVCFSGLAGTGGSESEASGPLDTGNQPIVAHSRALDYALLRLSPELGAAQGPEPAPLAARAPGEKDGVNLLHHPRGEAMRVSMCDAGVTRVLDGPGFVQYITRSAPGSSGGPCFDDEWKLVALHHAERARPFGRVGEGILIGRIHDEVRPHLG